MSLFKLVPILIRLMRYTNLVACKLTPTAIIIVLVIIIVTAAPCTCFFGVPKPDPGNIQLSFKAFFIVSIRSYKIEIISTLHEHLYALNDP